MQVTNLSYFYERSRKVRGGKWVWVKDSNGEQRGNVLLGGTIENPKKGFEHLYAAQLVQYTPAQQCLIFRSYLATVVTGETKKFTISADGYSDVPEVGMVLMIAPESLYVETFSADDQTGEITREVDNYTGQSGKVTNVEYDEENDVFVVTVDAALGFNGGNAAILVEAKGDEASATAEVLVPNPNTFIEADRDLMPTEGYGIENANYSISTVYNKQAWIERMQPLPEYVLANNRSLIDGIFWI